MDKNALHAAKINAAVLCVMMFCAIFLSILNVCGAVSVQVSFLWCVGTVLTCIPFLKGTLRWRKTGEKVAAITLSQNAQRLGLTLSKVKTVLVDAALLSAEDHVVRVCAPLKAEEKFRIYPGASTLLLATAATLTAPAPEEPQGKALQEALRDIGFSLKGLERAYRLEEIVRSETRKRVQIQDGKQSRVFLAGEAADLVRQCTHILDGAERPMTEEDRAAIVQPVSPWQTCIAYAMESRKDGESDGMTYLGQVLLEHRLSEASRRQLQALADCGLTVCVVKNGQPCAFAAGMEDFLLPELPEKTGGVFLGTGNLAADSAQYLTLAAETKQPFGYQVRDCREQWLERQKGFLPRAGFMILCLAALSICCILAPMDGKAMFWFPSVMLLPACFVFLPPFLPTRRQEAFALLLPLIAFAVLLFARQRGTAAALAAGSACTGAFFCVLPCFLCRAYPAKLARSLAALSVVAAAVCIVLPVLCFQGRVSLSASGFGTAAGLLHGLAFNTFGRRKKGNRKTL